MPSAAAPRWRRLGPDARREQIIEAGQRLFSEKPYSAVSTTELADAAGITRGLLHHYFGTKRDLYLEIVRIMLTVPSLDELEVPDGDLAERVAYAVDQMLDHVRKHGRTWVTVYGIEGLGPDPEVQALLDTAEDEAAELFLLGMGYQGAGKQRREAMAALRSYAGLAQAMTRELVVRKSITRPQARRLLIASLLAIMEEIG